MKTKNQVELAATVAARLNRIASFDKRVIGETKGFVNVASLPPDFEIAPEWDVCFASIMRPAAQKRIRCDSEVTEEAIWRRRNRRHKRRLFATRMEWRRYSTARPRRWSKSRRHC